MGEEGTVNRGGGEGLLSPGSGLLVSPWERRKREKKGRIRQV